MKKELPVFEIQKTGKPRWFGGAYTLAFVYAPTGNFLLKGYVDEIEQYLFKHYDRYFVRLVLYRHGQKREIFKFSNACSLYLGEPRLRGRSYCPRYIVRPYGNNNLDAVLSFKRFPTKWIPEFDALIDKHVKIPKDRNTEYYRARRVAIPF